MAHANGVIRLECHEAHHGPSRYEQHTRDPNVVEKADKVLNDELWFHKLTLPFGYFLRNSSGICFKK